METMIIAGRANAHLSGWARRRRERAEAFSRPTPAGPLEARAFARIERLVGEDHTPLSSPWLPVTEKASR
jgi:hypothetical protein